MTSKAELQARLAELTKLIAECECGEDSAIFRPKSGERYHYLSGELGGARHGEYFSPREGGVSYERPAFRTRDHAQAYAEALAVMVDLRAAKGVVAAKHGEWQYMIEAKTEGSGLRLEVRKRRDRSVKFSRSFSPTFANENDAQAAIQSVGGDRILKAMKTLANEV